MKQPNLEYIRNLAGDDRVFEQKFLSILKDEFPKERSVYEKVVEEREVKETGAIVHKMKHKFNILGMEEAYAYAVAYEKDLLEGRFEKDAHFRDHLNQVSQFLNTL